MRYVGAAYLIFLGVRRLLTRKTDDGVESRAPRTRRDLYTQGLVVNLLNPKTIVFIFAFIPQFVDIGAGHVWLQIMLLGLTFAVLGLMSDSLYAVVAGTVADRLRGHAGDRPRRALVRRHRAGRARRRVGARRAAPLELIATTSPAIISASLAPRARRSRGTPCRRLPTRAAASGRRARGSRPTPSGRRSRPRP